MNSTLNKILGTGTLTFIGYHAKNLLFKWFVLSLTGILFGACINPISGYSQQFEVDGQIYVFKSYGNSSITYFNAIVKDQNWYIKLTQDTKNVYDYQEISYDGKYCYDLSNMKWIIEERQKNGKAVGNNVATGWIVRDTFFRSVFAHEAGPIWLAYGSKYFFKNLTNNIIEPIIAYNSEPIVSATTKLTKQKIDLNLCQDFPGLPTKIIFHDMGIELTEPITKRDPPYDKGFTNVVFDVLATTNYSGMILPTDVKVDVFCPSETGLNLTYSYRISKVNIKLPPTDFSFKPTIPGLTHITDGRFAAEAGLISFNVKSNWPSETEVHSLPQFAHGKSVESLIERNAPIQVSNGKIRTVRALFILACLSSIVMLWYFTAKSKQTSN
jgi:hypothetical protein